MIPNFADPGLPASRRPKDVLDWLLTYCNSFQVLEALIDLEQISEFLEPRHVLRLLRDVWDWSDTIRHSQGYLEELFSEDALPVSVMMTRKERRAFGRLPDRLTIYRGCSERFPSGLSWSLSRDIAAVFPSLNRYKVNDPVLLTATVNKSDVVALKLEREEQEVITMKAQVTRIERLQRA